MSRSHICEQLNAKYILRCLDLQINRNINCGKLKMNMLERDADINLRRGFKSTFTSHWCAFIAIVNVSFSRAQIYFIYRNYVTYGIACVQLHERTK